MKSKTGRLFMVLGVLLILSSLGLLLYNRLEAKRVGESSVAAITKVQAFEKYRPSVKEIAESQTPPDRLVPVKIDGYGYIGYLSIPSLGMELPVMDDWDYVRLNIAPCRQ